MLVHLFLEFYSTELPEAARVGKCFPIWQVYTYWASWAISSMFMGQRSLAHDIRGSLEIATVPSCLLVIRF